MPPLPDLRFEQSYLKSIEKAEGWKGVMWITFRDQVGCADIHVGKRADHSDKIRYSCVSHRV